MSKLFFLQAAEASYTPLIFMVAMFAVLYFFMIRPQQKKAKEQRTWVDNLQKGDKIVTVSGIHGVVSQVSMDNPIVQVQISANVNVKMDKSAISLDMTNAAYPSA